MDTMTAVIWLAFNVLYEARFESELSQKAVVYTVLNRADQSLSRVSGEIMKRRQFSWTSDEKKVRRVRKHASEFSLPDDVRPLVRVVREVLNTPFYKRPSFTHYKTTTKRSTWACYPGGHSTTTFIGDAHVFCNEKDVVKPGGVPSYFKKRKARRKWRDSRKQEISNC